MSFEVALRKIKEATGVSEADDVIKKFASQRETARNLDAMKAEAQARIDSLTQRIEKTRAGLERARYSGFAPAPPPGGGDDAASTPPGPAPFSRKLLDELDAALLEATGRLERLQQRQERTVRLLVAARSGAEHLAAQLDTVPSARVGGGGGGSGGGGVDNGGGTGSGGGDPAAASLALARARLLHMLAALDGAGQADAARETALSNPARISVYAAAPATAKQHGEAAAAAAAAASSLGGPGSSTGGLTAASAASASSPLVLSGGVSTASLSGGVAPSSLLHSSASAAGLLAPAQAAAMSAAAAAAGGGGGGGGGGRGEHGGGYGGGESGDAVASLGDAVARMADFGEDSDGDDAGGDAGEEEGEAEGEGVMDRRAAKEHSVRSARPPKKGGHLPRAQSSLAAPSGGARMSTHVSPSRMSTSNAANRSPARASMTKMNG